MATTMAVPDKRRCARLEPGLVADARIVLADLDGCLMSGGRAYKDAPEFVDACKDRLWIVSNNSTHTAQALAPVLDGQGLTVDADRILLAGEQTLHHLARTCAPGHRLALFASDMLHDKARELGLAISESDAEIALLCRDLSFAIPDLEKLTALIDAGAQLWVSNTDLNHPSHDGRPVPETGALLAALRAVAGPVPFASIGKPNPHMVRIVTERTRIAAHDAVFVGDTAATDGALAKAAGMPFLHIVREDVA
ncbi:MAG: HAD hydrolase-like protein [Pseudomonadota bacterium]